MAADTGSGRDANAGKQAAKLQVGRNKRRGPGMFSSPRQDFLASIVVFLVALPLCMGIAIASGVPVSAGLITGIIGGIIVGFLAGAPLQVSGPAAGLTVIVLDIVQKHGLETLGVAVLIGGILQFAAGIFRLGQWFRAVSPAVVQGMLAGIGVLILSSQFHVMVDDKPKENGIRNLMTIPDAIRKGIPWPEFRSRAERSARMEMLKQFGALHEQQVQVRELVGESLALDAPQKLTPAELQTLIPRQREINDKLDQLAQGIHQQTAAEDTFDHEPELHAAVSGATAATAAALADLEADDVAQMRESQQAAQLAFEQVLGRLKDHAWAAKVGFLTIVLLVFWQVGVPEKLRVLPAPLVAVATATAVAVVMQLPVLYVEVPDNLWSEIHFPTWTIIRSAPWLDLAKMGLVIAVVASAETLLCATAVDQMQQGSRTSYDRELAAQGIGNMICGTLGALPMTGVIVRSAANIQAGGKTRLSTMLHGLWLLIFVSFLAFLLRLIPTASLAAMLVYTGYKLVNIKAIKNLLDYGWGEVVIYTATVVMIVVTDLLTGVIVGIVLSAAKLLYRFSHLQAKLDIPADEQRATLHLEGAATFIRLPKLAAVLERVPDDRELHVSFEQLDYIDHACLDLLMNWAKQHENSGGGLVIDWESLHANFHGTTRPRGTT